MFLRTAYFLAVSIMTVLLSTGCGEDNPSFSLLPEDDIFTSSNNGVNGLSKIDVLWVIDNSGSMRPSQEELKNNFDSFIQEFSSAEKNYDFQIAVTTTEAYLANPNLYSASHPDYAKFKDGTDATSHTGHFIITPSTPNLIDVFKVNIEQGTRGTGDERGLQSFIEALNSPLNANFLRDDAFLSVIIVSDENDVSRDGVKSSSYSSSDLHDIQPYIDYLDNFTSSSGATRRYSVSAMVVDDQACEDSINAEWAQLGWNNVVEKGQRYMDIANATDGAIGSLCGDFASQLNDFSQSIVNSAASLFYLSRIPIPESIVVHVGNTLVPDTHLVYDANANSVKILSPYAPSSGDKVRVDYDPVQYGS